MELHRREVVAGALTAIAGCTRLPAQQCSTEPLADGTAHRSFVDETGDGQEDAILYNDRITVQLNSRDRKGLTLISQAKRRKSRRIVNRVKVRPNSPVSRTKSTRPTFEATRSFNVGAWSEAGRYYDVDRHYRFAGEPFVVETRVSLFQNDPFVFIGLTLTNEGQSAIELDQDTGNVHDGQNLLDGIGFPKSDISTEGYRFYIPSDGTYSFAEQPDWKTFQHSRWATVFDDELAITCGLIRSATTPKMWLTENNHLDMLVNETLLTPAESISYLAFFGLHQGGEGSPARGRQTCCAARKRARSVTVPLQ